MVKSITCYMLDKGGQLTLNKITEEKKWVYGFQILRNLKSNVTQQYVSRATSALRLLKLSFQHLDNKIFDALLNLRLRVHLEHRIQAWSPHYVKNMKHIEKIQRRANLY